MTARLSLIFWPKVMAMSGLAALMLALCGCSGGGGAWPNLATVPSRAEAYRLTPKSPNSARIADVSPNRPGEPQALKTALDNLRAEVRDMSADFPKERADFTAGVADYEKAIGQMVAANNQGAEINSRLVTAQLYLSRLSRARDNLRNMNEKIDSRERDLLALNARTDELKSQNLEGDAGDLSQKLGKLGADVALEAAQSNAYVAGELARMKILSADTVAEAVRASPAQAAGAPAFTFPATADDAALKAGLSGVKGRALAFPVQLRAAGGDAALAARNHALIRGMGALLDNGLALSRIALGVDAGAALTPLEIRVYFTSP